MIETVLVPLDGSEFSEQTLPHALGVAHAAGATLHLVHVHIPNPPTHLLQATQFYYEGMTMEEYEEERRKEERGYLEQLARDIGGKVDMEVATSLLEGRGIAETIERHAESIGADLIVMTTHGRTGISRAWLGSVTDELVRHSHFPVLLVPPGEKGADILGEVPVRHVLVPLDGSERGESILGPAVDLGQATGARFTLLNVVPADVSLGTRTIPIPSRHLEERHRKAEQYLASVARRLEESSVPVETKVVDHPLPSRAILAAAQEGSADIIALATHGYRALTRAIVGSVADKVLRGSQQPILMLRPGD